MIELKQELEALAAQWHSYIGGGTMTNKEHAAQLRAIVARFEQRRQKELIRRAQEAVVAALHSGADPNKVMDRVIQASVEAEPRRSPDGSAPPRSPLSITPFLTQSIG